MHCGITTATGAKENVLPNFVMLHLILVWLRIGEVSGNYFHTSFRVSTKGNGI
jgi:hypothetical protein